MEGSFAWDSGGYVIKASGKASLPIGVLYVGGLESGSYSYTGDFE